MADPQGGSTSGRLKLFTRRPKKSREAAGGGLPQQPPPQSAPRGLLSLFNFPAAPPAGLPPGSSGIPHGSSVAAPRPPFLYRMRGAFGFLLALNLVLGGYMLFRGKALLKDAARMPDTADPDDEKRRGKASTGEPKRDEAPNSAETPAAAAAAAAAAAGTAGSATAAPATAESAGEASHAASSSSPHRTTSEMQSWDMEAMVGPAGVTITGEGAADGAAGEGPGVSGLAYTGGQVSKIDLDGQLEVLKWILEAKRREQHGASREERRRIDEQKRLLKDYIKAKKHLPLKDL
ncbi:hypothetical protein CLOM_g18205 [Closterium sp. NIES-68]|nr:hypothetical protein CLOM_g16488 [Closterium sp. NIES-68]GJP33679.1 hypothetical protein CLOM_g18205 [Closterium sp. NIES-68]GJP58186.1 hypothetical protein CLOP_g22659 [Closterium sp. NIES-67]GJP66130.1 hypothetical protein CLOP_g23042 [Closterium sp. NIES-67]